MLARANRLVSADDYRRVVRRGRRFVAPHTVMYVADAASTSPVRFGFIVPKSVGVAVQRNLVRRRMKAISYDHLDEFRGGTEIVFRAMPGVAQSGWDNLRTEIAGLIDAASTNRSEPRP
ncbi:hypothetical protein BH09ACT3_BH09ACT3_03330 [soil metagenome]